MALTVVAVVAFVVLAPVLGCLLAGADRIVTARMQGRRGPVVLQPYYDVRKLLEKDAGRCDPMVTCLAALSLLMAVVAGAVFFAGGNFLLCVFIITLSSLFFILACHLTPSPMAQIGAQREILQVMCYEPMVLFVGVALYLTTQAVDGKGSFQVSSLLSGDATLAVCMPLIFLGLLFVLTIKLRKSPFDLSMAHHAHQELVRGTTTEMSGRTLALVELTHWYETVLFLGWVGMFFINANPLSILLALVIVAIVWFLEIWIDNNFARVKWQVMLKGSWGVALVASIVNFSLFYYLSSGVIFF